MSAPQPNEAEKNIEIWKVKKLIKRLEAARGNGTSMISLIIREALRIRPFARWFANVIPQPPKIKSHERQRC
jgi:peptide chain release factor subunit 1